MTDNQQDDDQFAEYQRSTDVYEPEIAGPLIGQLQRTTELAKQYEHADPNFRVKTADLARTYVWMRTTKGDGNCGWRGHGFGYFETLLRLSDKNKIEAEIDRLISANELLRLVTEEYMIEDFTEQTIDLLRKLIEWLPQSNRQELLIQAFNDPDVSGYIVYHLRLLASAQMTAYPDEYVHFLEGKTISEYCKDMMIVGQEIDDISNAALYDILLKPAGFGLEILYLNRSEGEHIDIQARAPEQLHSEDSIVRLLYRPGHYDMIYKGPEQKNQIHVGMARVPSPWDSFQPYALNGRYSNSNIQSPDSSSSDSGNSSRLPSGPRSVPQGDSGLQLVHPWQSDFPLDLVGYNDSISASEHGFSASHESMQRSYGDSPAQSTPFEEVFFADPSDHYYYWDLAYGPSIPRTPDSAPDSYGRSVNSFMDTRQPSFQSHWDSVNCSDNMRQCSLPTASQSMPNSCGDSSTAAFNLQQYAFRQSSEDVECMNLAFSHSQSATPELMLQSRNDSGDRYMHEESAFNAGSSLCQPAQMPAYSLSPSHQGFGPQVTSSTTYATSDGARSHDIENNHQSNVIALQSFSRSPSPPRSNLFKK